jgi:hypothetical protein
VSIDDALLTCSIKDGDRLQFELETVNKVVVPKAGKYAKYGALMGAVGGASIGGVWAFGPRDFSDSGKFGVTGIIAGLGAAAGFLTGAVVGAPGETVYISKEAALAK